MKALRLSTKYRGRAKPTIFGIWDSYRDMLDYNKLRRTMCSQYTTDLVRQFYDVSSVRRSASSREWFGTTNVDDALEDVWTFINTDPLNMVLQDFNNSTVNVTTVGFSQKKKLYLNDLYRGVFSFDLAASYLYPKKMFYSPLFGQQVGIEKVFSEGIEPNLKFYYTDEPVHELERRDVYDADGNKMFSSTYDRAKCYIDLPKPKKEKFTVDLFCIATFNSNIQARQLVWNALAVNAIANTIINAGIELRIWCVTPLQIEGGHNMFLLTRIKNYEESLDTNAISVVCADPRFYRIHSFRARSYVVDELGEPRLMDGGMGYSITDIDYARSSIIELFKEERMFDDEQNELVYEENKLFLNVCLSEQDGRNEYKRVIDYFEMYADWKQMGQGADIKKFATWYNNPTLKNSMTFSEYIQQNP
jgi:hypothetical protein